MRKRLFLYLLNKYSKTEKDRIEIHKVLFKGVEDNYYEQTALGNLYNMQFESFLGNRTFKHIALQDSSDALNMMSLGIKNTVLRCVDIIKSKNYNGF